MKNILVSLVFLFFMAGLMAQKNVEFDKTNFPDNKVRKEALKNIETGDAFFAKGIGAYADALEYYMKAQAVNPDNAALNYKIGVAYRKINPEKSLEHLMKAESLNKACGKKCNDSLYYYVGLANHANYQFDKAIESYKLFKNSLTPKDYAAIAPILTKKIEECETGKILYANPVKVFIDNMGPSINTIYREYSPFINADESVMIFTSRRENTIGGKIDPQDQIYYEDLYIANRNEDNTWKVTNPGKPLNSKVHDATAGLSPDGQTLFIYKGEVHNGDVFECQLKGDKWGKPVALPKTINTKFHESSVSLGPDGRTLYFISDKEGSVGGRDIWVSHKDKKDKWGKAINLKELNTPYDEESIFIHPDGRTLYFSSQGHKTMGGFDIFKSSYNAETGTWGEPVNIGYPINTPDDDLFFTISASGEHAYMMSDTRKDGYGARDLYMVTFILQKDVATNDENNLIAWRTEPVSETVIESKVDVNTASLTLLKGKILDDATKQPVEASIILTDITKNEQLATFTSNSATGKYLVSLPSGKNYGIAVKAEGYLFHSENFDIPASSGYQEVEKDIYLKKIEVGKEIVLKNIFFDFAKATLRPESVNELENLKQLMNENPTLKIEISGHTDNVGSAAYNKDLSNRRAKAVVDYLVKAGISADRMTSVGYGFDKPIAPNDTDAGRQLNRRTEFKITSK
jgi:outer membrane protein OmpA-like peptidoglycan-associated protein/tetratricopeptide (TPR) repeat protein